MALSSGAPAVTPLPVLLSETQMLQEPERQRTMSQNGESILSMVQELFYGIIATSTKEGFEPPTLMRRVSLQLRQTGPKLWSAVMRSAGEWKDWVVAGGTLRILLTLAVLSVTGCAATGLAVFGLILAVATANAMLVALVLCIAAACSFLAMFLAALSAIYVAVILTSATIIGVTTLVAMSSAFGMSAFICGWYLAYRAGGIAFKYTSAKADAAGVWTYLNPRTLKPAGEKYKAT